MFKTSNTVLPELTRFINLNSIKLGLIVLALQQNQPCLPKTHHDRAPKTSRVCELNCPQQRFCQTRDERTRQNTI